jgi:8-oxo-dGTP diphosphatase
LLRKRHPLTPTPFVSVMDPQTPLLTVDCVAFDNEGAVVLVERGRPPFEGHLALPGGFVSYGESAEDACRREFQEETGLTAGPLQLVGVYSDPERDPRGHVVSVAFTTTISRSPPKGGDDARHAMWVEDWRQKDLAFDHRKILMDASQMLRRQSQP